jgi:glutamate dehydrogenase
VEDTGSSVAQVARAYAIAREVFEIRPMWAAIEAADRQIATDVQYDLMFEISRMIRRAVYWFLKRYPEKLDIAAMVQSMRPGIGLIAQRVFSLESVAGERRLRKHLERLTAAGVDPDLAQRMVALTVMTQSLDIIEVARDCGLDVAEAAQLYFELSRGLRIGRIRHAIEGLEVQGRWRAIARATLRENLAAQQSAVLRKIVAGRGRCGPRDALAAWLAESKDEIRRVRGIWADMEAAGPLDFATLSVAIREIERLT